MMETRTDSRAGVRVLGIDPGTRILGYGILDVERGRQPGVVAHGAVRLPSSPLEVRLETIFREVREIILRHAPGVLAIEQVFHGKNFESVLKLGEARGVVVLAAQMAGLEIREYSPAVIKSAATGNGNADKSQVQRMMARILGLAELPEPEDVTDALAVAFCHGQRLWRESLRSGRCPVGDSRRRLSRPEAFAQFVRPGGSARHAAPARQRLREAMAAAARTRRAGLRTSVRRSEAAGRPPEAGACHTASASHGAGAGAGPGASAGRAASAGQGTRTASLEDLLKSGKARAFVGGRFRRAAGARRS